MNLPKPLIALLFLFTAFSLKIFSQSDTFDISEFKLPEIHRRQLDFNADFYGYSNTSEYIDTSVYGNDKHSSVNGKMNIHFSSFQNTRKVQSRSSATLILNGSGHKYNSQSQNDEVKEQSYSPLFSLDLERRRYFKNETFLGTSAFLHFLYNYDNSTTDYPSVEYPQKNYSLSTVIPIAVGKGRIEPVQDARQALYIIDALEKEGRLRKDINRRDIENFADLVAKLNSERYFDYRIQRMHELEALDSFLVANHLVRESDARYFTVLSDYWDYGNRQARYSGNRISVELYPGYNLYNSTTYESPYEALIIYGGLEFIHEKPINLYWQNTLRVYSYAGKIKSLDKDKNLFNYLYAIPDLSLGISQIISYYPNTRTNMSLNYGLTWGNNFKGSDGSEANHGLGLNGRFNINYYFSPQLRLNFTAYANYFWQGNPEKRPIAAIYSRDFLNFISNYSQLSTFEKHSLQPGFSLSFTYMLF